MLLVLLLFCKIFVIKCEKIVGGKRLGRWSVNVNKVISLKVNEMLLLNKEEYLYSYFYDNGNVI